MDWFAWSLHTPAVGLLNMYELVIPNRRMRLRPAREGLLEQKQKTSPAGTSEIVQSSVISLV